MPREVFMPALGMAQDEGIIVAWLKQPGDAVAEGDPLMEIETDKATMEVEAHGAGFLTDIRAGAGDSVPVGQVIAVISETAEGEGTSPPHRDGEQANEASETAGAPAGIEGHDVIMPALGMAQDTGRLVAWLVAPGAEIVEGDPLFEVETDKATMEVSADRGGYLGAVYAEAGADVPVGDAVGVLTAERPDTPIQAPPPAKTAAPATAAGTPPATEPPEPESPGTGAAIASSPGTGARILASPKARRLAAERGLDLGRLVAAGIAQPFHVRDLDRPEANPPAEPEAGAARVAALHRMTARAPAGAFDALAAWAGDAASAPLLLVALAAGAMRGHVEVDPLTIELRRPGAAPSRHTDPDLPRRGADDGAPTLILHDLTGTRITGTDTAAEGVPVLSVTRDGDAFAPTLAYPPGALDDDIAADILSGLADRLADPMRQLF